MKSKLILTYLLIFNFDLIFSKDIKFDKYLFSVDLNDIQNDQVKVKLEASGISEEKLLYRFPKTIPRVYKNINYGEMISSIEAYDQSNERLRVKKIDKNSFMIFDAERLRKIEYKVNDTWDHAKKKNNIWAVIGTNIQNSENYILNAPGWFGYFDGYEDIPIVLKVNYPIGLIPFSALPFSENIRNKSIFLAEDYHHLIDSPIMISKPDTATFSFQEAKIYIEVYHENGRPGYSNLIKDKLKSSLKAVNLFWGDLSLNEYHFIIYLRDGEELAETLFSNEINPFKKIMTSFRNRNLFLSGALEHKESSFYVLSDFGDTTFLNLISRIAIHELMHLITPISLYSSSINTFDYHDPKTSKHLWLYEGVIEYFTILALLNSGLINQKEFLFQIKEKIKKSKKFPYKKISFSEMSENIYQKKYRKYYYQVYERGALIAFLLDIEIIRLTLGKKTLKDVIYEISNKYNDDVPFSENLLFDEITGIVHPDLRSWFSNFIEGNEKLEIKRNFDIIGLEYKEKGREQAPLSILKNSGIKLNYFSLDNNYTIRKIDKNNSNGFMVGDVLNLKHLNEILYKDDGYDVEKDSQITINLRRNQKRFSLPYKVSYAKNKFRNRLRFSQSPSKSQKYYYDVWSAF